MIHYSKGNENHNRIQRDYKFHLYPQSKQYKSGNDKTEK